MSTTDEEPKEGTIDSVDLVGDDSVDNIPSPGENAEDVTADGASFGDAPVEVQVVNGSLPEEAAAPPASHGGDPQSHPVPSAQKELIPVKRAESTVEATDAVVDAPVRFTQDESSNDQVTTSPSMMNETESINNNFPPQSSNTITTSSAKDSSQSGKGADTAPIDSSDESLQDTITESDDSKASAETVHTEPMVPGDRQDSVGNVKKEENSVQLDIAKSSNTSNVDSTSSTISTVTATSKSNGAAAPSTSVRSLDSASPQSGDNIFKPLINKIKSLELNQSLFDGYVEDLNKKYLDAFKDVEEEIVGLEEKVDESVMGYADLKESVASLEKQQKEGIMAMKEELRALLKDELVEVSRFMDSYGHKMQDERVAGYKIVLASTVALAFWSYVHGINFGTLALSSLFLWSFLSILSSFSMDFITGSLTDLSFMRGLPGVTFF